MGVINDPAIMFLVLVLVLGLHLVLACTAASWLTRTRAEALPAARRRQVMHAAFSIALFSACLHLASFEKAQGIPSQWTKKTTDHEAPSPEFRELNALPAATGSTEHLVPAGCASDKDLSKLPSKAISNEFNRGGAGSEFPRHAGTLLFLDATFSSFSNQWRTAAGARFHHL